MAGNMVNPYTDTADDTHDTTNIFVVLPMFVVFLSIDTTGSKLVFLLFNIVLLFFLPSGLVSV